MTTRSPLRDFLVSRRAQIDPASVDLPPSGVPRRGRGLRREEVAVLAGVSVDYYARLEQGRVGVVSDQVLTAIENALQLDQLERQHFRALVSTGTSAPRRAHNSRPKARAGVRALIESMDPIPVILQSAQLDVLATNSAARTLITDFDAMPSAERNIIRWLFLSSEAKSRYLDWDEVASRTVAALRAAHDPRLPDESLERLVGELSVASAEFARYWADYRLFKHTHGTKRIYHEAVGEMTLNYETLDVPGSGGQFLSIYTADVGSPSAERLSLLLSWDAVPPGSEWSEILLPSRTTQLDH